MDWHNKDNSKNTGDMRMDSVADAPDNLEDSIDFSHIAQAEVLKLRIEHFRRRRPHCSGTLMWHMDDCWPVQSRAVLDCYGFGKASYLCLKRVHSPVLASFRDAAGRIELWISNDTLERVEDEITLTLAGFAGEVVDGPHLVVDLPPASSERVNVWPVEAAVSDRFPDNRHLFVNFMNLERQPAEVGIEKRRVSDHDL